MYLSYGYFRNTVLIQISYILKKKKKKKKKKWWLWAKFSPKFSGFMLKKFSCGPLDLKILRSENYVVLKYLKEQNT